MSVPCTNIPLITNTGHKLTPQEAAFIASYVVCKNATQAVAEAGYKCKAKRQQASALLSRSYIGEEITYRLNQIDNAKIADATEVLQFYTSVMRGEVLDQFGIEASLDTRIKAANEIAKHKIELPMKLEQKNITNNIGSIQLNFLPRKTEEIIEMSNKISDQPRKMLVSEEISNNLSRKMPISEEISWLRDFFFAGKNLANSVAMRVQQFLG